MIMVLIGNIAHPHIKKKITVGIVGERGCFPFLFFTREIALMHVYVRRVNFTTKSRLQNTKLRSFT